MEAMQQGMMWKHRSFVLPLCQEFVMEKKQAKR